MEDDAGAAIRRDSERGAGPAETTGAALAGGMELIVPYRVYTRSGPGAFGVIVETAREALAKAAQFGENGHQEVLIKDLVGNVLTQAAIVALAEGEDG
jgi:hypothetical protein